MNPIVRIKVIDASPFNWYKIGEEYEIFDITKYGYHDSICGTTWICPEDAIIISDYREKQVKVTEMGQLSNMLVLATQRHDGQFDRGGKPYILHCLKVMHYLKSDDEELCCIALGHDLIEDTFPTIGEGAKFLRGRGFSERVVQGIMALTKIDGEPYEQYQYRVKSNIDAVKVKMSDLRHNTDIRRLKGVTEKDIARVAKYHKFYLELQELLGNQVVTKVVGINSPLCNNESSNNGSGD